MKPRQKVVTAEDITSSLYFLHVEQPEDANLVAPPQFQEPNYQDPQSTAANGPSAPAIQRKAVQAAIGPPTRKPVASTLAPIEGFGNKQNISAGNYTQQPGMLAADFVPRRSYDAPRHQGENYRPAYPLNRSPERPRQTGTILTLIRRDPASGAQWNVARIEDPSTEEVSSSTLSEPGSKRKIGAPLYIDITNPGYSKFLQSENANRPGLLNAPSDTHIRSYQPSNVPQSQSQPTDSPNIFRRRLWMEGSQYTNGGFGHRKNSSYDFNSGRPGSRGSYDARTGGTQPGLSPSFLTHNDQTYDTIQISDKQTSFRGYVFTSPWNGRCEFITGGGGGSLKVAIISDSVFLAYINNG
jgi:hypothetical protein